MSAAIESYELTIDDFQIMRVQRDCPTVTIPRNAVRKIAEREGQGFRIESDDSKLNIWVPRELEGYDAVKTLLLATSAAATSTMRHPAAKNYALVLLGLVGVGSAT
jgi:hypothetical protein